MAPDEMELADLEIGDPEVKIEKEKGKKKAGRKSAVIIEFPDTIEGCLSLLKQEKDAKMKMKIRGHLRRTFEYYISKNKPIVEKAKKEKKEKSSEDITDLNDLQ